MLGDELETEGPTKHLTLTKETPLGLLFHSRLLPVSCYRNNKIQQVIFVPKRHQTSKNKQKKQQKKHCFISVAMIKSCNATDEGSDQ